MTESGSASFGDAAGEMANETEVEVTPQGDASASAGATGSGTPDSPGTGPAPVFSSNGRPIASGSVVMS